jgi:hypothetical protein
LNPLLPRWPWSNSGAIVEEPAYRVLGNADGFEALWVLVAAETYKESRKPIATVSTFVFDFFAGLAPGRDHSPRVAAVIDVLAQIL